MRRNFPARKGQEEKEQGGRKVDAEEWQAEIAKYKTTRMGLDYVRQSFVTIKEQSSSCFQAQQLHQKSPELFIKM